MNIKTNLMAKVEFTPENNRNIAEIIDWIDPYTLMDDPYTYDARPAVKYIIACEENACEEIPTPWHDNPGWITITAYDDDGRSEVISEAYTKQPVPLVCEISLFEDGLPDYGRDDKNWAYPANEWADGDGYISADEATERNIDKKLAKWTEWVYELIKSDYDNYDVVMLTDIYDTPCGVEYKTIDDTDDELNLAEDVNVKIDWDKQYWD